MRSVTFALLCLFALPISASDPAQGPQPTTEVMQLVRQLVKRTKTEVKECPTSMSAPVSATRVCGVTEMPMKKFRSRVETVFDMSGPSVRQPWSDRSGATVGRFTFIDPLVTLLDTKGGSLWTITVSISPTGQPNPEAADVVFAVWGTGVKVHLGGTP